MKHLILFLEKKQEHDLQLKLFIKTTAVNQNQTFNSVSIFSDI